MSNDSNHDEQSGPKASLEPQDAVASVEKTSDSAAKKTDRKAPSRQKANRRRFIRTVSLGCVMAGVSFLGMIPILKKTEQRLRPPGSLEEHDFLASCIKCGQCVQVCPVLAIKLEDLDSGYGVGTPYIDAREQACDFSCDAGQCILACPTGALTYEKPAFADLRPGMKLAHHPLLKAKQIATRELIENQLKQPDQPGQALGQDQRKELEEKLAVLDQIDQAQMKLELGSQLLDQANEMELLLNLDERMGVAELVRPDLCLAMQGKGFEGPARGEAFKGKMRYMNVDRWKPIRIRDHPYQRDLCDLCVTECPIGDAIVLNVSTDASGKKIGIPVVKEQCIGCGVCQMICPTEPAAIVVKERREWKEA